MPLRQTRLTFQTVDPGLVPLVRFAAERRRDDAMESDLFAPTQAVHVEVFRPYQPESSSSVRNA